MFIPFYSLSNAGCVIGVFGLYMRKSISISEKYEITGIDLSSISFPL